MKRSIAAAFVLFVVSTALLAAPPGRVAVPAPDFWYVVPGETTAADAKASKLVQGIVVPTSVHPTVQATPTGSVVSWRRPDGTRQSFVIQGMSSFTFEPGPLANTTYARFRSRWIVPDRPAWSCCACATYHNMEESISTLSCVAGCTGCGCEACICSPTFPCPEGEAGTMTLVAHNDPAETMTFKSSGGEDSITVGTRGRAAVQFHGNRLFANVTSTGETMINNPDLITLSGSVTTAAIVRDDDALFGWSSPEASVILEQPRSMPAPSFQGGTIEFDPQPFRTPEISPRHRAIEPLMDRCMVCGTHPNSDGDLDAMTCIPGVSTCYRCIGWEC